MDIHAKYGNVVNPSIYLDYNATAPIRPEVIEVMADIMSRPSNASSVHALGRAAKSVLEQSRRVIAQHIGCFPSELIFTASGSEAIVTSLRSFAHMPCAVAATEHSAVINTAQDATLLPVDVSGLLDMGALEAFLHQSPSPALIAVMLANNETGVIQPIPDIARLVHKYNGLLFCDAVQGVGKIPVDINALGADMLSVSAHKIGGPQGIGALYVSQQLTLTPLITGGGQEMNRRAGTENLAAIAGFSHALELAQKDYAWQMQVRKWLDAMEQTCQAAFPDDMIILGKHAPRLPNTSALCLPGMSSETQLMRCDLSGIALSAGSACSSGRIAASHVVQAMLGNQAENTMIRVSAGWNTTKADINAFTEIWLNMAKSRSKRAKI